MSNSQDGVFVDADGRVPSFQSDADLLHYTGRLGFDVVDEKPVLHDLDALQAWLSSGHVGSFDCNDFLSAWNLFGDVARSVGGDFDSDMLATDSIYQKLFCGTDTANNVLRPPSEPRYTPAWTQDELHTLRQTLSAGLTLFHKVVVHVDPTDKDT